MIDKFEPLLSSDKHNPFSKSYGKTKCDKNYWNQL